MAKKVTLSDIAQLTGLSMTSISLVLNDRPNKIPPSTKKLILDAAQSLGYKRIGEAALRRAQDSRSILQIVPDIANSYFAELVQGVDSIIKAHGYRITLSCSNNDPSEDMRTLDSLIDGQTAGVLFTPAVTFDPQQCNHILNRLSMPVILVDRTLPSLPLSSMTYNHKKGAYLATRCLLQLGHRKIVCLSGGTAESFSAAERIDGYRWAFAEMGLSADPDWVISGDYTSQSGYTLADQIIKKHCTAVFSCNDMMAYGIYKRARELGIRIPEDLSIIGYDDNEFSNLIHPPLSTVHQSAFVLGQESAKMLLAEMSDQQIAHQSIFFEPSLMVRTSTAPLHDLRL